MMREETGICTFELPMDLDRALVGSLGENFVSKIYGRVHQRHSKF